nr:tail fiber domain-containing protein [Bacteroidales bacterium]
KRYEFIDNNPSHKESIGIIAQDLQKVFPEFVSVNKVNDGNPLVENQLGVDYAGLSVLALKAIQEQQNEITLLKAEIELLKKKILILEEK